MSESGAIPAVDAVYFVVLAILIGLATLTVARAWPPRWPALPIPFTAWILGFGLLFGLANEAGDAGGPISGGITAWTSMNHVLIFAVFLPVLVFGSALTIEMHKLRRQVVPVAVLAVAGTLFNAALIAVVCRYVLPFGWSWSEASLLGSILSATDPVAVVALMKAVGASEQLATVMEGESLLNDGAAYVLYQICVKWQAGENLTAGGIVGFTFKVVCGGVGMGLAFGLAAIAWLVLLVGEDPVAETWIILLTSYACFLVSDELLHVSGMLALVFCGLVMAAAGWAYVSARSRPAGAFFWRWADWTANVLIFFLSGAIIAAEVHKSDTLEGSDWGWAVVLWLLLLAIRGAMVVAFWPILSRTGYGMKWRDGLVLTWGGLRGAVGLVLALSVRNDAALGSQEFRDLAFFLMALQAMLTCFVQGSTMAPLLGALGFLDLSQSEKAVYREAAGAVEQYGRLVEGSLRGNGKAAPWQELLGEPDWDRVDAASAVGITDLVDKRPARKAAEPATAEERTEDLRQRVLGITAQSYDEMLSSQFLSPPSYSTLKASNEAAMDEVETRLAGWSCLTKRMDWLRRMEALDTRLKHPRWLRHLAGRATVREAANTAAFILAQRYAAAQLDGLAAAESGKSRDGNLKRAVTLDRSATLDWRPLYVADISTIDHAHRDALLADVLHRGATALQSDGLLPEGVIATVRAELAEEERQAQEHLASLRERHPEAVKQAVTLQMSIALLDRKVDLLAALQSAGLLEAREVGQAMDAAVRRTQAVRYFHKL